MEDQGSRVALVTGAEGALGKAVAHELARHGWSLMLQYADEAGGVEEFLATLREKIKDVGANAQVCCEQLDVTRADDRDLLVEQVLEVFGRIDMLVNTPSSRARATQDVLEMTEDAFRGVIDSTLTATVFLTQLVANEMVRLVQTAQIENPKIVTINSIGAYTTSVDHGASCIARAGLGMLTRLFADRLGEHGINVYEVRVGITATSPSDPAHAKYDSLIADGLTPIRRWGRPQDPARAVSAIASDLLDFSTGEVINVDGGFHLRRL